ncbi:hypothetical protein M0534_02220 [Methylonatrum kenyense]|uniref:hypothetical protein n=1 Tax=Methylonatrum kenyense TaxID=455253 RepID=UPI0020BD7914|nr:hypothetical protein [Methylonatrum kenyense]MCK8515150.1 hypothetical protein [Methylonatrum kenyense]
MPGSITVKVCASECVAPEVRRLTLEQPDLSPLPAVRPGDHIRLSRRAGPAVPVSIAAQPQVSRYQILVADRTAGSDQQRTPRLNERLTLEGPGNGMPLNLAPASVRLIGAGLGIAPLLPLARVLLATECRVRMCWVGRGITASVLQAELAEELQQHVRFHDTLREGRPDLRAVIGRPGAGAHLYCAGPIPFIEALLHAAAQLGWSADKLHWDRYLPVQVPPGLQRVPVTDSSSGLAAVQPAHRS